MAASSILERDCVLEVTTTDLERRCPRELTRLGGVAVLALERFGAFG